MRQSFLFYKTYKDIKEEEKSINAQLLIRAGFIERVSAGIYNYQPLGCRVLDKISRIIKDEMFSLGGQEVLMPAMHPKELWQKTGRWDSYEDIFKIEEGDREFALGPTHEEIVVPLVKGFVQSYQDLPLYLFQIQNKFRKEKRAKSGLLRGREFLMKDLYSFHTDEEDLNDYYDKVKADYVKIFKRTGIGDKTYITYASGGTFSKYSHEFQTITEAGEDTIHICEKCGQAINEEIKAETPNCLNCGGDKFITEKAVEVGNIFKLRTKYSAPFDLSYTDKLGKSHLVEMGCYGIGLSRQIGTIVEVFHDDRGIIWPDSVAPFLIHLLNIGEKEEVRKVSEKIHEDLVKQNVEVLYDDRNKGAGEKFTEADLIGIPWRFVVSEKSLKENAVEVKRRDNQDVKLIKIDELPNFITKEIHD
ncbi:MAG: aminoacyl--tRNA ligase-related protein [bacterium]